MFLSDVDVSDVGAGVGCTNLRLAEKEIAKLRELYSAISWMRGRL